jgi:hypothetical protein
LKLITYQYWFSPDEPKYKKVELNYFETETYRYNYWSDEPKYKKI